jgi:exopolysaccharide biosynthesis WecB/TagA/CpsF family protein
VHGRSPFNECFVVIFDMLKNSIAIVASHCCDHVARFVEERFFGISVPVATATGIAPQPHCHQETDMLDAQTRQPRNLTVDGITINILSLPDAVSSIVSAAQHGDNFSVCTLNLDHVVQLQQRSDFRAAYRRARFVTADGFPIVVLSRLLGTRITRTTGADLVEPVCQEAQKKGLPIFMLGSNDRTLSITAKRLSERFRGLEVAGYYAPGANFDPYSSEADFAIDSIRASGAKLCFVALGAPRQELFAARCLDQLNGTGLLCIGAALDFIAGTQTRAPSLTQKLGLEWAWRMLREPRRLGPRYARCIAVVPRLVARTIPQIVNARMRKAA